MVYLTRAYFGMSYSGYWINSMSDSNYPEFAEQSKFPVNLEHQYSEMRAIKDKFRNLVVKLYPIATTTKNQG
jgi:hypothetical protein